MGLGRQEAPVFAVLASWGCFFCLFNALSSFKRISAVTKIPVRLTLGQQWAGRRSVHGHRGCSLPWGREPGPVSPSAMGAGLTHLGKCCEHLVARLSRPWYPAASRERDDGPGCPPRQSSFQARACAASGCGPHVPLSAPLPLPRDGRSPLEKLPCALCRREGPPQREECPPHSSPPAGTEELQGGA